jgi:hypothetical protein
MSGKTNAKRAVIVFKYCYLVIVISNGEEMCFLEGRVKVAGLL